MKTALTLAWTYQLEREKAHICETTTKQRTTKRYNYKLQLRAFKKGDLIWHMVGNARKSDTKFSVNWEGPF